MAAESRVLGHATRYADIRADQDWAPAGLLQVAPTEYRRLTSLGMPRRRPTGPHL